MAKNNRSKYLARWVWVLCLLTLSLAGCTKSARTKSHIAAGDRYLKEGEKEKARIEFINALSLDRTNAYANLRLGEIYFAHGEYRPSFIHLSRAKQSYPDNTALRLMVARILHYGRDSKQAQAELELLLQKDSTQDEAIVLLSESVQAKDDIQKIRATLAGIRAKTGARVSLQVAEANLLIWEGKFSEAQAAFQAAEEMDSKFVPGKVALANFQLMQNDLEKAGQAFQDAVRLAPSNSVVRLAWVDFKSRTGQPEEAKKLVAELSREQPDFLPAVGYAAQIAYREKNFDESLALIKKLLARDGMNYDAQSLKARILVERKETAAAVLLMEQVCQQYPRMAKAHFQCAETYLIDKQPAKAISSLEKAITLAPGFAEAIMLLAEVNLRQGNAAGAATLLADLIVKRPMIPRAHLLLGSAYVKLENRVEALAVYREYSKRFPKDSSGPFLAGMIQRQLGQVAEARAEFEKTTVIAPDNYSAWGNLIELDLAGKDFAAARGRAEGLVARFPKASAPKVLLARVHSAQNEFEPAEAALLEAIEIEPTASQNYLILANLYARFKKLDQAIAKLESALAKNPKRLDALMAIATLREQQGEFQKAAEAYAKVIQERPRFGPALNNLAFLQSERLNQLDSALEHARRAREVAPADPAVGDTLGWIHFRKKQPDKAAALLREASEQLPNNGEVQYHFGTYLYSIGDEDGARRCFEMARKSLKDPAAITELESRMAVLQLIPKGAGDAGKQMLRERIGRDPADVVARARLAEALESEGAVDEAIANYEMALKSTPGAVAPSFRLARLLLERKGDFNRAIELLKPLRSTRPDDAQVAWMLGRAVYRMGDFKWSVGLLGESAQSLPNEADAHFDYALACYAVGQLAASEREMKIAAAGVGGAHKKEEAQLFLEMMEMTRKMDAPSEVRRRAEEILARDPQYVPALMAVGSSWEKEQKLEQARASYQKVLEIYPSFGPALKRLAMSHGGTDDKKAYELANRARTLAGGDDELSRFMGAAAFRLGDFKSVVSCLTSLVEGESTDAESLYYLGVAQSKLKRHTESKDALARVVALQPDGKYGVEAKRLLSEPEEPNF